MDPLEGEEGACCRICRLPESQANALYSPCKCSGSIKYVHQGCLISWLDHSGHQRCELCRHKFQFRPVYAPDAPSSLPWAELAWGLVVKSATGLALFVRLLLVVTTWLFVVPLLTCWMWRLAFLTSIAQGLQELLLRLQPVLVLADCIQGSIISSALILLVLLTTYTADQIKAYWQILQPHQPAPAAADAAADLGEAQEAAPVAGVQAHPLLPEQATDEDASEESDAEAEERRDFAYAPLVEPQRDHRPVAGGQGGGAREGLQRRQAAGRAQPLAPAAPAPRAPAAQARQHERDQFAFNELIGLEGPINILVENAATVLFTIWVFMTAALWMPFMLGRTVAPAVWSWRGALAATALTPLGPSPLSPGDNSSSTVSAALAAGNTSAAASEAWEGLGSKVSVLPLAQRLARELEAHLSGPGLNDWACLGIGYAVLFLLAGMAFSSLVAWKLLWRPNLREGLWGQTDILKAALSDISRQTRVQVGYAAVMIKVSVVLTLELTLLPALHGCWVDVCLLPLFGSSWSDRILWLQASPISFLLVHWVLGMGFLMLVATFLSIVRQQLRPGALPFFRDPYEGDEEPMRALMMLGLGQQLEREAYALSCLACLTVLLLHFPLRLTKAALPSLLPLRFSLSSPFTEAPTDLLLFHFILPITIPRLRVRYLAVQGVRLWLRAASRVLRLDDYLLPSPHADRFGQEGEPQAPPVIPHGFPGLAQDPDRRRWQEEIEGARQRSGRLLALLVGMVGSLVVLNTALLNLPILTGRFFFWAARLPSQHDLYNCACGAYALWGLGIFLQRLVGIAGVRSVRAVGAALLEWSLLLLRAGILMVVALGVLPLLIGLYLELAVLPLRLRPGESPSCFVYQDWAVGLLLLRLFASCLLGLRRLDALPPADQQYRGLVGLEAAMREPLRRLQANARRIRGDGLARIRFSDAFTSVLWPLIMFWGVAVSLPFVVTRGVAPLLPFLDEERLHVVFTHAWAFELAAAVSFVCSVRILSAVERLGSKLRDQRYLLHRELINMSE